MKRCPNCNLIFDDDGVFCVEDGATLLYISGAQQQQQHSHRFSVSLEQPTQFVPRPVQPPSFPLPNASSDNSKGLYLVIGMLVAIILSMAIGFVLLRDTEKKETADTRQPEEKSNNENTSPSSNKNPIKTTNQTINLPANKPPKTDNTSKSESNTRKSDTSLTRSFSRTYSGTADDDGITMQLQRSGSSLSGRVFSRRSATEISVSGSIENDGSFEMSEHSDIGVVTGVYQGRISSDGTMSGTWTKPDGSKPRSFFLRAN